LKINKILSILLLLLLVELITACCNCIEPTSYYYTNCSLTVKNLDNSGPEPVVAHSDTLLKNAYGIRVTVSRFENTCITKVNGFSFIQSAYAFDCFCPPEVQYLALDSIASIEIKTINDFDAEHLANSNISDYFYVFGGNEFTPIVESIANLETTLYDFENPTLEFDLLLMSPPTAGTRHQFEVLIGLSDGRVLTAQTGYIELI
jgi:hypothetical protein